MKSAKKFFLAWIFLGLVPFAFSTEVQSYYSRVEGKIAAKSNANGIYDFRFQIWDNSNPENPKLYQTIILSKVLVHSGMFSVKINLAQDPLNSTRYITKVESRVFESWKPYQPAELIKVDHNFESTQQSI